MNHSISTMTGKTKLKIILLGNQGVGKSSIIDQYINNRFEENYNATVGIDFLAKNISHNSKNYRLQLWDTAGQQRFRSLIPSYLKDAHCAFIIFDVGVKSSLNEIDLWVKMFNDNKLGEGFIFLFREVTEEEGRKKADSMHCPYYQMSAKTAQNVSQVFTALIQHFQGNAAGRLKETRRQLPKDVVRQQKQDKQQDEVTKTKPERTQTKIAESSRPVQFHTVDPIALKKQNTQQPTKDKKKGCC